MSPAILPEKKENNRKTQNKTPYQPKTRKFEALFFSNYL